MSDYDYSYLEEGAKEFAVFYFNFKKNYINIYLCSSKECRDMWYLNMLPQTNGNRLSHKVFKAFFDEKRQEYCVLNISEKDSKKMTSGNMEEGKFTVKYFENESKFFVKAVC